ncbi:hypothetical protein ACLB2K_033245 [Fragaria x ananassa]
MGKTIGEIKHHSLGFSELEYSVHRRSSMVPPQHPDKFSTQPRMMKEMSAGEESSSTKAAKEELSLKFLNSLRDFPRFKDFQNLMKEFKINKDMASMAEKMAELFQGHPELIAGFNQFLPERLQITIPKLVCLKRKRRDDTASDSKDGVDDARAKDSKIWKVIGCENKTKERFCNEDTRDDDSTTDSDEDESTESKLEKVIAFVNKVEERFRDNNDGVELFLDMVCKRSKLSPNRSTDADEDELQIYKKVVTLLGDHHDLIDEFTQFLTEVPRIDSIIDFNKCKRGTPSYRLLPMNFPIPAATGRSELAPEVLNDHWICVDTSPKNVKSALGTIEALIEKMHNMSPEKKICIKKRRSHMSLIRCIIKFYGCEMIDAVNNNIQVELPVLLERLKQKEKVLRRKQMVPFRQKEEHSGEISRKDCIEFVKTLQNFNSYVYQEFVHLMKDFKPESDDCIKALKHKLKELFEGRPDLILGFNAFLPKRHKINVPIIPVKVQTNRRLPRVLSRKRKRCDNASDHVYGAGSNDSKLQKVIDFVNKVKDRFHNHDNEEGEDVFQSFLDVFLNNHHKRNKLSPSKSITADEDELQIYKTVEELFDGHPDLIDEFTNFLPTVPLPTLSSVIDSATCETCTPSYRLLPENFPIPAATKRSKLASQVLNDRLVCFPSTTSRGGGGNTQQYKSGWEDKRFEVDRKVNTVKSTLKSISALMQKIEKDCPSKIYVEDHLTELNLKCIQRCYEEQGLKVMDELRKDIRGALPLLMKGLKLQEEKLKQHRSSLNRKWACHVLSCR